jgi:hypothetical protein
VRHKWALFFIFLLYCTITVTATQSVEPVACQSVNTLQDGENFLNVTKTVKPKEAWVDQNVTVTVEIKNPENVTNANTTVFKLNVTEEALPSWSFTTMDTGNVSTINNFELGVKENVTGYYVLRPEKSGNYTLPGAKITYEDENGTKYETFTEPVILNVLPKITTEDWRNVLLLCITAIGIPGVPWALLYFTKRKTFKVSRKKRKR